MWAVYWRTLLAMVLAIFAITALHQQFGLMNLVADVRYHASFFWTMTGLVFVIASIFHRNGLIYFLWGRRLAVTDSVWLRLNVATIIFVIGLALLALVIGNTASHEVFARYKLLVQPAALMIWPIILAKYTSQ